jgi:hypothetical protein
MSYRHHYKWLSKKVKMYRARGDRDNESKFALAELIARHEFTMLLHRFLWNDQGHVKHEEKLLLSLSDADLHEYYEIVREKGFHRMRFVALRLPAKVTVHLSGDRRIVRVC